MKLSKEAKTAIIILLGVGCFIFGFNFLKSTPIFNTDNEFYAKFKHSAGLQVGSNVTVNGVTVGNVQKIKIDPQTAEIVVTFSCKDEFTFSENSKAEIYSSLLGTAGLQIIPALDNAPNAKSGDFLVGNIQSSLLDALGASLEPTTKNLNETLSSANGLMANLSNTLDEKAQKDIQQSLQNLNVTLQNMNQASASLNHLLAHNKGSIEKSLANVQNLTENFSKLSEDISKIEIAKLTNNLESTLHKVNTLLSNIENGDGTISKLINDKKLYNNLQTASSELGLLMEDIRKNPKRYVHISIFGANNKKYETPNSVEPSISERAELLQQSN
ncbi:MAG: MlaD family protein [Capnocytophaga sp.]|nr:MlaD family protein [Capnocytophaga sp.]